MWIAYSLLGALLWAIASIVDKYVLTKLIKNLYVLIIILWIIWLIVWIVIIFYKSIEILPYFELFLTLITWIFSTLTAITYFKALQTDQEVSRLVPIFYTTPIFVWLFAFIFLWEIFENINTYYWILLLVIWAVLINYKQWIWFKFDKSVFFILLSVWCYSVTQVITKYLLEISDFWTIFAHIRITSFIFVIPFIIIHFNDFKQLLFQKSKKPLVLTFLNEWWNLLGYLFITLASSIWSVTLVNAMISIQPMFVLIIAVFLSIFYPKIIKEELWKWILSLKIISILIIIMWAFLIT